jgi:hypothetical protein
MPKKISQCDVSCSQGEFIDFDLKSDKIICKKCHIGTYSTGGSKIFTNWNEQLLSEFNHKCEVLINGKIDNTEVFDSFRIEKSENKSYLISGGEFDRYKINSYISYQLVYSAEFKKNGIVKFNYKKDTLLNDKKYPNGLFKFYIDYENKIIDSKADDNMKEVSFNIEKGYHSFMWEYVIWVDVSRNKLRLKLNSIEFIGLNKNEYECLPCDDSSQASNFCRSCPTNSYMNQVDVN